MTNFNLCCIFCRVILSWTILKHLTAREGKGGERVAEPFCRFCSAGVGQVHCAWFRSTVSVPSSQSLNMRLWGGGGEGRGEQWVRRHDGRKTFGKVATSK